MPTLSSLYSSTSTSTQENNQTIIFLSLMKLNSDLISSFFLETSGLPGLLKEIKCNFKWLTSDDHSIYLMLCKDAFKILRLKYEKVSQ